MKLNDPLPFGNLPICRLSARAGSAAPIFPLNLLHWLPVENFYTIRAVSEKLGTIPLF